MKRMIFLGVLAAALALEGRDVTITYRGRVVGDDDRIVTGADLSAVVGLYDTRLAPRPLLVVTNAISPGANGAFQTEISAPELAGLIQSNRLGYVGLTLLSKGVTVGDGEIQPRQPILSHPLAGWAANADALAPGGEVTRFEARQLIYADSIVSPTDSTNGPSRVQIVSSLAGVGGTLDLTGKWNAGEAADIRANVVTGAYAGAWTSLGATWSRNWNVSLIKGERPANETLVLNGPGAYFFSSLGELADAAPTSYAELNELRNRGWRMPGLMLFAQTNELANAFGVFESCCRRKDRTGEKYVMPMVRANCLPFNAKSEGGAR